jgi:hypothetical protein
MPKENQNHQKPSKAKEMYLFFCSITCYCLVKLFADVRMGNWFQWFITGYSQDRADGIIAG